MPLQTIITILLSVTLVIMIAVNILLLLKRQENVRAYQDVTRKAKEHSTLCSVSEKINLGNLGSYSLIFVRLGLSSICILLLCKIRLR